MLGRSSKQLDLAGLDLRQNISFGDTLLAIFLKLFLNCEALCNKIISQLVWIPLIFIYNRPHEAVLGTNGAEMNCKGLIWIQSWMFEPANWHR